MASLQISIQDYVLERLRTQASAQHLTPEAIVESVLEGMYSDPDEIEREIRDDPELQAIINHAEAEYRAGRFHTDDEVMDWESKQPD